MATRSTRCFSASTQRLAGSSALPKRRPRPSWFLTCCDRAKDISILPLTKRRVVLENLAQRAFMASGVFCLSPASRNFTDAHAWLSTVNEDHDGDVAKRLDLPYRGGARDGMQKIKLLRSADCVVGGFRYGE